MAQHARVVGPRSDGQDRIAAKGDADGRILLRQVERVGLRRTAHDVVIHVRYMRCAVCQRIGAAERVAACGCHRQCVSARHHQPVIESLPLGIGQRNGAAAVCRNGGSTSRSPLGIKCETVVNHRSEVVGRGTSRIGVPTLNAVLAVELHVRLRHRIARIDRPIADGRAPAIQVEGDGVR